MECGAGGAVATDRSSIPLRTTTCVNLCEGITYGRRTRAHLRGFDRLRATSVAGRARGAGVATRVLFVCCRRVCDMASTFLFSFFSVSRTFVHRCRVSRDASRARGWGIGENQRCRYVTFRQSCAGARDHERRITADLRRGVACRVRPAAGAPHARATHTELRPKPQSTPRTANGGDTRDRASVRERTEWDVYVDD